MLQEYIHTRLPLAKKPASTSTACYARQPCEIGRGGGVFMAGGQSWGPEERDPATVTQAMRGWPQPEDSGPAPGCGGGLQLWAECAQCLPEPDPGDKEVTFDL